MTSKLSTMSPTEKRMMKLKAGSDAGAGSVRSESLSKKNDSRLARHSQRQMDRGAARQILDLAEVRTRTVQEESMCNQLFMRILGGLSLTMGFFLLIVSVVIMSTPCCGDQWSYDEEKFLEECRSIVDRNLPEALQDNSAVEQRSCYSRNIYLMVSFSLTFLLMLVGLVIVLVGECAYSINEDKDEDKLNATARHLKWLEMEQLERESIEKMRRREIEMMETAADEERREREAAEEEREYQRELDMMSGRSGRGRAYNSTPTPGVVASQPYLYGRAAPFVSGSAV